MTPARLHALLEVHADVHRDRGGESGTGRPRPSSDPAADLAALASLRA